MCVCVCVCKKINQCRVKQADARFIHHLLSFFTNCLCKSHKNRDVAICVLHSSLPFTLLEISYQLRINNNLRNS